MKIVCVMPLKLNNERLPGKNTLLLGGKPLFLYQLEAVLDTHMCNDVYVYCSDQTISNYLPNDVTFLQRSPSLDLPDANFTQIFQSFSSQIDADIYVYIHATAPFIKRETIAECIEAVLSGNHDSSFCAVRIQDFLWQDEKPLNFDATNLPRSQDLNPIYRETSGVYVFRKDVFMRTKRRIGYSPFIKTVSYKEAVDINTQEDFDLAVALLGVNL